jgi:hypothetical protein
MKSSLLFIGMMAGVGAASAQQCQVVGNMMTCPSPTTSKSSTDGSAAQRSPSMNHYSYTNPHAAQVNSQAQNRPIAQQSLPAPANQPAQPVTRYAQPSMGMPSLGMPALGLPPLNQQRSVPAVVNASGMPSGDALRAANAQHGAITGAGSGTMQPSSASMSYSNGGVPNQGAGNTSPSPYASKPCQQMGTMTYCN